jgi:hypothetical protein
MREELHRYLDGELDAEALPLELQREAEAWQALLADVRLVGPSAAPADLETRVLDALSVGRDGSAWSRFAGWWVRPRSVRVSPLAGLLAAAALGGLLLLPFGSAPPVPLEPTAGRPLRDQVVYVQFLLRAPDASQVAVAGDFTDWLPEVRLVDLDGDGTWSGRVALRPGVHEYMFVIDGDQWMTDPHATRYEEDGYGQRNAVLAVAAPAFGP